MRLLRRHDDGMVTAEAAVTMLGLVAVLALALAALALAGLRLRCDDAARVAARAAVRGESREVVVAAAHEVVPDAVVRIDMTGNEVRITVSAPIPLTGTWSHGLPESVSGSATGMLEQGGAGPAAHDALAGAAP